MKKIVTSLFLLAFCYGLDAQKEYVSSEFDRPSISALFLNNYDSDFERLENAFSQINPGDKFFINQLDISAISLNYKKGPINVSAERKLYASKENKGFVQKILLGKTAMLEPRDSFGIILGQLLQEKLNVGGQAVSNWAETDAGGDFVVLNARSDNNLNSNDIRDAADHKKLDNFKNLLFKNYILVYDLGEATESGNVKINSTNETHAMLFSVYVYKIDIDDQLFGKVLAPNFKDRSFLKNYKWPLKYMGRFIDEATVSETDYDIKNNIKGFAARFKKSDKSSDEAKAIATVQKQTGYVDLKVSKDTIYSDLMQEGFDITMLLCEKQVEDFKVRTSIANKFPLQAEIGRREGLKADQRYFVYEYREDPATGEVFSDFQGIVRAVGPIADNLKSRTDESGEFIKSNFKQTYGSNLKEGMFMVQNNSLGAKFAAGLGLKNFRFNDVPPVLTLEARLEYSFSDWFADIFSSKKHLYGINTFIGIGWGRFNFPDTEGTFTSLQLNFGISKDLYFSRKFDLVPYIAFVSEQANLFKNGSDADFAEQLQYLDLGCRVPIPITRKIAIEPSISLPLGVGLVNAEDYYQGPIHFTLNGRIAF